MLTTTVTLGQAASPTVVINEFVAINDSGLRDKEGDFSDWLELHNYGTETVDLTGAALTDSRKRLAKWTFPEIKIEPGQYLVVFMSGKDRRSGDKTLHANFALRGKGDYLGLIAGDGETVIDEFAPKYPDQKKDIAFGILPGQAPGQAENLKRGFLAPTPGKANARPLAGTVKPVKFSEKRGWHEQSFKLTLSTKTKGATIRYTLDGTRPTPENGYAYESPVDIVKTITLRAAAFKKGHKASAPSTRTFLFLNDIVKQSPDGLPPEYFPFTWGDNKVDYGMDQRIVNDPHYAKDLVKGFHSLPSFSLVMNLDHLLDGEKGIYA
ncbi:MAG: chitobiase/beta-hexosaminidase C-terminal domain-containing protein, partial [Verrucomicrobiota bacterium]|nr:chitobiase/beta-hexosaminidase C-terminal domain-containing protein [Verrucomicrobiota bacterium]